MGEIEVGPGRSWRRVALALCLALFGCRGPATPRASDGPPDDVREFDWADSPADPSPASESPPPTLTASDGTGLRLVALRVRAKVEGPLSYTELHFEFENPSPRILDGTFSLALPPSAKVHRFALRIGENLEEAEIVESERAVQAYESSLHRRIDPALLRETVDSRFRARVFPIAPREKKELVLSYSEILSNGREGYRLPLRGFSAMDLLDVRVGVAERGHTTTYHVKRERFSPRHDLVLPADLEPAAAAVRSGTLVAVRVPVPAAPPAVDLGDLTILLDTSASRSAELAHDVDALSTFLSQDAPAHGVRRVFVAGFDQDLFPVYDGPLAGFDATLLSRLLERGAGGATDFTHALAALPEDSPRRLLVSTDGLATVGADSGRPPTEPEQKPTFDRIDVALSGPTWDRAAGERLSASGRRSGVVVEGGIATGSNRARLLPENARPFPIRIPNAAFVHPGLVPASAAGSEIVVFAEVPTPGPFTVVVGEQRRPVDSWVTGSEPLLARRVANARVERLMDDYEHEGDPDSRGRLRRRVTSLAIEQGVLGPFTSLLVMETDDDFRRFGIERTSPQRFLGIDESSHVSIVSHPRPSLDWAREGPQGTPPPDALLRDSDGDTIRDVIDQCPMGAETWNGISDEDGCPDKGVIVLDGTDLVLIERIRFRSRTAELLPESVPLVDAMAQVLVHHREFRKVEIAGYTDSSGETAENRLLGERRARAVVDALVKRGIEPTRLVAVGYGEACPLTEEHAEEDRAKNRRVEFKVLELDDGPTEVATCARQRSVAVVQPPKIAGAANTTSVTNAPPPEPSASWPPALEGDLQWIHQLLELGKEEDALPVATANLRAHPQDAVAWIALGDVRAHRHEPDAAARAYGSLLDLDDRAETKRAAGGFLEFAAERKAETDEPAAARLRTLAVESYRAALALRPEHPSSHRLLAFALARLGRYEEAFHVLYDARVAHFRSDLSATRTMLLDDLALVGAAWAAKSPDQAERIHRKLAEANVRWPRLPTVRVVLSWETDASDVNLYVKTKGAWLSTEPASTNLRDGYGPEEILETREALPLRLGVRLARRGVQGDTLGKVDIVYADGAGHLTLEAPPFALSREGGYAELGEFSEPGR